jgi:hypothetical protein
LEGLEGAATLSSLESQSRIFNNYQDDARQDPVAVPSQPSASFPQDTQPAKVLYQSPAMHEAPSLTGNSPMLNMDESSLAGFLNNVMDVANPNMEDFMSQDHTPRDIFNFGIDADLAFNDMDYGWITSQNSRAQMWNYDFIPEPDSHRGQQTPDVRSGITAGAKAYERSLFRWAPQRQEHAYAEQVNLSLPKKDIQNLETRLAPAILDHRLEQSSRDRILAMLLSTCEPANIESIVTSFPSAEVLDQFIQIFFGSEVSRSDSWIHLPTFKLQAQRPELTGIIVAAGACLSPISTVRKLGFAIQEAVRISLARICENDNSRTRELELLQTYALELGIGLWSGNKRKMEIAESNSQPLVTVIFPRCGLGNTNADVSR